MKMEGNSNFQFWKKLKKKWNGMDWIGMEGNSNAAYLCWILLILSNGKKTRMNQQFSRILKYNDDFSIPE